MARSVGLYRFDLKIGQNFSFALGVVPIMQRSSVISTTIRDGYITFLLLPRHHVHEQDALNNATENNEQPEEASV